MPIIADIPLLFLGGLQEPLGQKVEEITRQGVNSHAYRKSAIRGDAFEMIGKVDCDTIAAATALYEEFKLLEGELVTLVDDYGETTNNVMIEAVRLIDKFKLLTAVGGVSTTKGAFLVVGFMCRRTDL